jgi:hypothetical protein
MAPTSIAKRLRERAEIARILGAEANNPEEQRAMGQLVVHYEMWADRLERDDDASMRAPGADPAAVLPS